jgi:hypothetical protein
MIPNVKRCGRVIVLPLLLVVAACSPTDTTLQSEVAALREDVSTLRDDVNSLLAASDESTTTTAAPTTTSTSTTTSTTAVPLPEFPPEVEQLTHGGDVWVVVLAAAESSNHPALRTAVIAAANAGYATGPTDCDFGAREALGLSSDRQWYTVSVYLQSEDDAHAALAAFEARGIGGIVAMVQTFCLD